jgi:carbamoyltransferase
MNILGISGLAKATAFKRAAFPGRDEREYRIAQGMDSAAALLVDGKLVAAAEEERFTREKHTGDFPIHAIRYCLKEAGITIDQVDELAHGFDYTPWRELYEHDPLSAALYAEVLSREALLDEVHRHLPSLADLKVHAVGHHLAHAASAAFTSGWDECLVLVNDAMGEVESLSVYDFHDGQLERLSTAGAADSIGILYSLITLHLGFDFNAEHFRPFFEQAVEHRADGSIRIPMLKLNRSREEREFYLATRAWLDEHLIPRRDPGEPVTPAHQDVAAALQECLERALLHICGHFAEKTGLRRIALAGGVALNCTANGMLMHCGLFDEVYVQPVAGDDGTALGAALYRASIAGEVRNRRMAVPLLGPRSTEHEIEAELQRFNGRVTWHRFDSLAETCASAAALIAEGHVIAWHRGRLEYGPRALGNRSILADPGHPDFHALLLAVGQATDRQMVLNTSFNVKGQPIVNTPAEAIETFLSTGIEFLFLENFYVTRSAA